MVREIIRNLDEHRLLQHKTQLDIYQKVLLQKRSDSNKIYSLHAPEVKCFTKGKEHKKFEFGSKAALLITQRTNVIVGALNFSENIHDSKTLPAVIEQYERLKEKKPKAIFADRGYRGPKTVNEVNIYTPKPQTNITKAQRKKHCRRAAIEPVIGHLKYDYRLIRNYLKGTIGDAINLMLSAAAMNFKRVINLWLTEANFCWKLICNFIANIYWQFYALK